MKRATLMGPLVVALALSWVTALADTETEVNFLIDDVAASGCDFQRNGTVHDSVDAADHLRLKYRRGKRYADTAEHFIDHLATESSWTGQPYTVICDGVEEPSGEWLHRRLQEKRDSHVEEVSAEMSR